MSTATISNEPTTTSCQDLGRTAFFYGTLMSPKVLHRVCHGDMSPSNPIFATHNLRIYPALLHNHSRHCVLGADYPGVVPHEGSAVRGTYVTGLTEADVLRLDLFEGSEYARRKVMVRLLDEAANGESGKGNLEASLDESLILTYRICSWLTSYIQGTQVPAETYIWTASPDKLEDREWDFALFRRDKEQYWVGVEDIDDVVAAPQTDGTGGRGANGGYITDALLKEQQRSA